jgi:hypothetical protein
MEYYIFTQKIGSIKGTNVLKIKFDSNEEMINYIKENIDINEYIYKVVKPQDLPKINPLLLVSYNIVENALIPEMSLGKEITRKPIRKFRQKLFLSLDTQYIRALEDGDTIKQQEIVAQKKKLRDVTKHPLIENAQTLEELSNIKMDDLFK